MVVGVAAFGSATVTLAPPYSLAGGVRGDFCGDCSSSCCGTVWNTASPPACHNTCSRLLEEAVSDINNSTATAVAVPLLRRRAAGGETGARRMMSCTNIYCTCNAGECRAARWYLNGTAEQRNATSTHGAAHCVLLLLLPQARTSSRMACWAPAMVGVPYQRIYVPCVHPARTHLRAEVTTRATSAVGARASCVWHSSAHGAVLVLVCVCMYTRRTLQWLLPTAERLRGLWHRLRRGYLVCWRSGELHNVWRRDI